MLLDLDILRKFGTTNKRLKEIFISEPVPDSHKLSPDEVEKAEHNWELRKTWIKRIRTRLEENITFSLRNYQLYSAADIAWDSAPINKMMIPMIMYAQGKITMSACSDQLNQLGCADQFVKKGDGGKITGIDLPKFYEVSINLVRSFVTRRLAAQSNKYSNLWPYFKYEPRGTSTVSKFRGDVLSQRVDVMADQFDYRHHDTQVMRDMLLYGHSVDFVRASWETDKQLIRTPGTESTEDFEVTEKVMREGLSWVNPHPSRVFWDNSQPLASINSDTGCEYIGFWDVRRYGEIMNNPLYFNRTKVKFSSNLWEIYRTNTEYFNQYITTINPPAGVFNVDVAGDNDRRANIGVYTGDQDEDSVFLTEYYEKIIPSSVGVGDYPHPVWVRITIASDDTVIHAEILPSSPASYMGYNENDSRQTNISFAHEVMPFQDAMSNLMSQMLIQVQVELLKIIGINTDVLDNKDQVEYIRKQLGGRNYSATPLVIEYSMSKLENLGIKSGQVVTVNETRAGQSITVIFQAMAQLIQLLERLVSMSPAEQGQPAPREISATEVAEIASTTSTVYSFLSDAIDEFRAAKKRIIYESLVCCATSSMPVPVANRYTTDTVKKAGFLPVLDESEDLVTGDAKRHTVMGSVKNLIHDYVFSSRDGSERPIHTQAANVLVQLLSTVLPIPGLVQKMGKEKLYEILNEIFRMSGAGVDLKLELAEGEDDSLGEDQVNQLMEVVQQLAQAVNQNSEDIAGQQEVNQTQEEALQALGKLAKQVQKIAEDLQDVKSQPKN